MVIASILAISIVIAGTLGYAYLGKEEGTKYYALEIYVLSWDMNATELDPGVDVRFEISIDRDGDGDFDVIGKSQVFNNTTVEVAPFRFGTNIPTSATTFSFRIDVFQIVGSTSSPLAYTDTGSSPVNQGNNDLNSTKAWSYDGTTDGANVLACRISYLYFVNEA